MAQPKRHVRSSEVCLNFYREQYGIDDIDRIFDVIIKNQKKQEKRRNDRANGRPRDRPDNARRYNLSIRTQKKNFCKKIISLFEKRCVFCQRYTGDEKIAECDVGPDVDIASAVKYEGSYWVCKMCKSVKDRLLNGESVIRALADIEARHLEEMKQIVGLVEYNSGDHIQKTYLPIIGDVDFQFSDDPAKPVSKDSNALVFEHMVNLKNKEAISSERIQLFSQVGHHHPAFLLDTMYR